MSKVICDICGTSYPDTATQCPICGCVRPAETVAVEEGTQESGGYTYVKGGRFSKSNVRKRNKASAVSVKEKKSISQADESQEQQVAANNKRFGLIIVLTCLLLIVSSMFIYIGITMSNQKKNAANSGNSSTDIPCTGITVSTLDFSLNQIGEVYKLEVVCTPSDTTDDLIFTESSGGKIVTVDQNGNVTCVANGKAVITVTCGEQKKECRVSCTITEVTEPQVTEPEINVRFLRYDLNFSFEKQQASLYAAGDVTAAELTWVSDDTSVATVDNDGIVYAVANGETDVHAKYNGEIIATCHVLCQFKDLEVDNTQEGGENTEEYLFGAINGGYSNSLSMEGDGYYGVTLGVGERFQFGLIHPTDKTKVISLKWERVNPDDPDTSVSVSEDQLWITRDSVGNSPYCQFKATYNGKVYYLRIR